MVGRTGDRRGVYAPGIAVKVKVAYTDYHWAGPGGVLYTSYNLLTGESSASRQMMHGEFHSTARHLQSNADQHQ